MSYQSSVPIKPISVSSEDSSSSIPHKRPVGAIIGGLLGGVAFLAIVLLGLVFLLKRKRNTSANVRKYGQTWWGRVILGKERNSDGSDAIEPYTDTTFSSLDRPIMDTRVAYASQVAVEGA